MLTKHPYHPASTSTQPTLIEAITRAQPYKNDSIKKKELDDLVVRMIVEDLQPLSVVEDKGFKKLVNGLNPRYDLPSRREIGRTLLPSIYNREIERARQELDKVKHISLKTDIWTSRQTKAFITVTAHYISPEWILKSVVLDTVQMVKSHTADNIAEELRLVRNKWGISDKINSIVTDNAANMTAAIKQINVRHIPCFAHSLNLVVQDSIKTTEDVQKLKEKIKTIVSFFQHSVKASDKLTQVQEQHKQPPKKIIQDVETRWNSTYYMMERYLEQHEHVTYTLCYMGKNNMCLTNEELVLLQDTINVLEPFEEATKEMSAEKVTSLSKVIPMVRGIQECMNSIHPTEPQLMNNQHSLGRELQNQMERRFSGMEGSFILKAATLLDPRFKKLPFSEFSNTKVVEERLVNQMRSEDDASSAASTSHTAAKPLNTTVPQKKKKSL